MTLQAGCAYLLANSAGSTTGDQTYGTGITDDGGVAVLTPALAIVDQVGQSAGSAYKEGTPLAPTPTNGDRSYERTAKTGDTGDNAADFTSRTPADPETGCDDGPPPGDQPPSVTATDPADGASQVDEGASIRVTFSEPVTTTDAFGLACDGGAGDQDADDPPDQPASDFSASFHTDSSIAGPHIHDLQGAQHVSPGVRAPRGPIVVRGFDSTAPQEFRRGDMNPERIILNDANDPRRAFLPIVDVGDRFTAPVRAVVDYSFGNFKFLVVNDPPLAHRGLRPERTRKRDRDELAVASYNVENLDGVDDQERFDRVADQIVGNLRSPDILSLEEIQDNDGAGTAPSTQADVTYARLIEADRGRRRPDL